MSFYICIYFDSDKSLSTVPKSRCALRGPFEAGQEAEVNWGGQRFIGVILKTADKGMFQVVFYVRLFVHHRVERSPFWRPVNRSRLFENAEVYLQTCLCLGPNKTRLTFFGTIT